MYAYYNSIAFVISCCLHVGQHCYMLPPSWTFDSFSRFNQICSSYAFASVFSARHMRLISATFRDDRLSFSLLLSHSLVNQFYGSQIICKFWSKCWLTTINRFVYMGIPKEMLIYNEITRLYGFFRSRIFRWTDRNYWLSVDGVC